MSVVFGFLQRISNNERGIFRFQVLKRRVSCCLTSSNQLDLCSLSRKQGQQQIWVQRYPSYLDSSLKIREFKLDHQFRCFARQRDNYLDDIESFGSMGTSSIGSKGTFKTSTKQSKKGLMHLTDDDDLDQEEWDDQVKEFGADPEDEARKQRERAKLELKKEFQNRKGRGWTDPMDMEPFYVNNIQYEDLPDWTPASVSAVSRERVQIHPDKIPTLAQLARLPLPPPVHPNPGEGKPKAYALHRKRAFQRQVANAVRAKAAERVQKIQTLRTWQEKQNAVDDLFETLEADLRKTQVVLGRHPNFGEWVEKALEQYLLEVDETSQNSLFHQVSRAVRDSSAPLLANIEALDSLQERSEAARDLFDSLGSRTILKGKFDEHPLFGQWLGRALEEYLTQEKNNAESILYEQVAGIVRSTAKSKVDEISLMKGDKHAPLEELAKSITNEELKTKKFDAKRYNLLAWLKKAYEDHLYQKIASIVRSDDASYQDMKDIDHPETQRRVISYRAKLWKQKLEQEGMALAKHDKFLHWTKRALEESLDVSQDTLFKEIERKVLAKISTEDADPIRALPTVDDKWIALDKLSAYVEDELAAEELAGHYQFGRWVKRALKEHFQKLGVLPDSSEAVLEVEISAPMFMVKRALEEELKKMEAGHAPYPTAEDDEKSVPTFMDCFGSGCNEKQMVPDILRPLKFYDRSSKEGRMIEEWLLAADKETKRIMLRESTRRIAQIVEQSETNPRRVLVHGKQGVGKTAVLAAIVACARKSGHIVHYMPDSRVLHEHGYYNVPSKKRDGIFELPILSKEQCQILLDTHRSDMEGMRADRELMGKFFTDQRMELMGESKSLVEILELGLERELAAPACFSCVIEALMTQSEKPFTMVVDEFNVFFGKGHYFNMAYDEEAEAFIPYDQINLFKHHLDAAGLNVKDDGEVVQTPVLMKKGAIVVATSEGHGVARTPTDTLLVNAQRSAKEPTCPLDIVEVPRLSKLEVEHMLAHYETIGMGNLRMDNGETVTNPSEVEYLRMLSSANPQKLLNACILP